MTDPTPPRKRSNRLRFSLTMLFAAVALGLLPTLVPPRVIGTLVQMEVAALFALAFNILWRQTRLLSFGHAAYFGIGMVATIHVMRGVAAGVITLPLPLIPVSGLLAGLLLGLFIGYFATARTGTYFAMITLACAELLHQIAPQWESVFGGEAGISTMRQGWAGLTFGSNVEVYYLISIWSLVAVAAMYFFTRTPLGRLAFALGDNEARVSFLGYNARTAKALVFGISAMFAGLSGALLAVANENVDHSVFSAARSGLVVIHTFVGGAGLFLGPVVGAAGLTLLGSVFSDITRLWILYQGLLFIFVVMFIPQGVVGLVVDLYGRRREGLRATLVPLVLGLGGFGLVAAGVVFVSEFVSGLIANPFAQQSEAGAVAVRIGKSVWYASAISTWAMPVIALLSGGAMLWFAHILVKRSKLMFTKPMASKP